MAADRTDPADLLRLGSLFGRYRLDSIVGRGGMGVVFRATDTSLERPVALKVLSPELAAEPSFRARFERESRLAAAIEHPSIVPIYEAGAIGETLYIAMRYVPGRDLGTILRLEAPLDFERTLSLVRQVADALDAAHRRGLVHRDVKPGNVLVERDGGERAFLADFGLSRRLGEATVATRSGALGTIDYVAPEQVEGRLVDGRTDQYALACVVVHCLTGSPPFSGDSDAAVLFAHVNADPPRLAEDAAIPTAAAAAIARAMAKSPHARFPDCDSFATALRAGSATSDTDESADPSVVRSIASSAPAPSGSTAAEGSTLSAIPARRRHPLAVGAVVAVAAIIVSGVLLAAPPPGPPPEPAGEPGPVAPSPAAGDPGVRPAVLGPIEGEVIYFDSDVGGDYDLYAIESGRPRPRRLTRTPQDERQPAVSPDGATIAYVVGDEPRRDIWLMDADGSRQRPFITHRADDTDPAWSADGRSLAFASRRSDIYFDIYEIRDRGDGLRERDARNLTDRLAVEQHPDWAPGPRRIAIASNHFGGERDILIIDPGDREELVRLTSSAGYDQNPRWSPDRATIAFDRRPYCATCVLFRGPADIHAIGLHGRRERRLTDTPSRDDVHPDWSPDGRAIVYSSGHPGAMQLYVMTPDGERRRRLTAPADARHPTWVHLPSATEPPVVAPAETVSDAPTDAPWETHRAPPDAADGGSVLAVD